MIAERLVTGCWVAWMALRLEQRAMRHRPMVVVVAVIQPVVFLTIVVGTRNPAPREASALVAAVVLNAMWTATVWTAGGVLRRERQYGTLPRTVTGLYSPAVVVFGKSLGATVYSLAAILVSSAVVVSLLGVRVTFFHPAYLVVALLVVVASATALGMALACLFLVTRHGLTWSGALIYPVFIVSGLLIPAHQLPGWLEWVPSIVSLHWINEFITGLSNSRLSFGSLAVATGLSGVYLVVGLLGLRAAVRAGRRGGRLDFI